MENLTNENVQFVDVVEQWLNNVAESSTTKNQYASRIKLFREFAKMHNVDISTLKDQYRIAKYKGEIDKEKFIDSLVDLIDSYKAYLIQKGYAPTSVYSCLSIVQSFLKKGCRIKDVEVSLPKHVYQKYHNRDITKEEIKKILEHAPIRERTFWLMMYESGLRPRTLVQLKYKHIKEDYEKGVIPMKISLPSEILKDYIGERFCFVGEDSVKLLREYLSLRPTINDEDYIFKEDYVKRKGTKTPYLSPETFSNKFSKLVIKLGLDKPTEKGQPKQLREYCLRKAWFKYLTDVDSTYKNFWFCHTNVNDHYITRDVEVHRQLYAKAYPKLRIFEPTSDSKVNSLENELMKANQTIGELKAIITTLASNDTIGAILGKDKDRILEAVKKLG